MKKIALVIAALVVTTGVFAQTYSGGSEAPDYPSIKNMISEPDSDLYYPRLMERMQQGDPTLTVAEYRLLYYGALFQPGFSMLSMPSQEDELMQYYQSTSISPKQYDRIIELIRQVLEVDPFYLRGLNYLSYVLHLKGEEEQSVQMAFRLGKIIEAIRSSGNGMTQQTGLHVIHAGHEYVVMNFMQLRYDDRQTQWIDKNAYDSFSINRKVRIYFCVPYSVMNAQE